MFWLQKKEFLTLLLLLCDDIQWCPGPPSKSVHQNICGLLNKIPHLETFASDTLSKIDIISLSEMHSNGPADNDDLYTFIKNSRKNGLGGGVDIFLKNGLNYKLQSDVENSHMESTWLEIFVFKTKSILLGCYYRPPENSKCFSSDLDQLILEQLETVNCLNKEVIIIEDFNISYLSKAYLNVKRAFKNLGLIQIIKTATRITENSSISIDQIFTNKVANVTNASSFCLSFSDHDMIGCVRKINTIKYDPRTIESLDYKHYNHSDLCNDIKNINWKPIEEASDVNKALKYFNTKVSKVFDRHAPTIRKKVKERLCKWLIRELKKEVNNQNRQLRKAIKSNLENDWPSYKRLWIRCNTLMKKEKTSNHQNLQTENETNPRHFWNAIKEIYQIKHKPVGSVTTNKKDIKSIVLRFSYFFKTTIKEFKEAKFPLVNLEIKIW